MSNDTVENTGSEEEPEGRAHRERCPFCGMTNFPNSWEAHVKTHRKPRTLREKIEELDNAIRSVLG